MKSSYTNHIDFGKVFASIAFSIKPLLIVEIGILDGFSLQNMCDAVSDTTKIHAYDIFDSFNGNHANYKELMEKFKHKSNVDIMYGDFYKVHQLYQKNSIDILHIDIANTGDIFEYVFQNYMDKLKNNGIVILEGGSVQRDDVDWMIKLNKKKINPIIEKYKTKFNIYTIDDFPSITLVSKIDNIT